MGECYEQLRLSDRIYIQSQLELGLQGGGNCRRLETGAVHDQAASCGATDGGVRYASPAGVAPTTACVAAYWLQHKPVED